MKRTLISIVLAAALSIAAGGNRRTAGAYYLPQALDAGTCWWLALYDKGAVVAYKTEPDAGWSYVGDAGPDDALRILEAVHWGPDPERVEIWRESCHEQGK